MSQTTLDAHEIHKFAKQAGSWWDETGPFKTLHQINPVRLKFIVTQAQQHLGVQNLKGLSLLDVGCGGGILSEPLARQGSQVTGLDGSVENIYAAQAHAQAQELSISYLPETAEDHAAQGHQYDIVCALELIEHVADPRLLVQSVFQLLKPGGLCILSTLNRTISSFVLGIGMAEYVLRWVPRGTHSWKKFVKPSELAHLIHEQKGVVLQVQGVGFNPFQGGFSLVTSVEVNYLISALKPIS